MDTTQQWIDAGDYSFRLDGETIIARNAKGRVLKSIPPKARKTEVFQRIEILQAYLQSHEVLCGDTVRDWFLKGLPVPVALVAAVWPDPAWQRCLKNLVVSVGDDVMGFLRSAIEQRLQLVDLDGETVEIGATPSKVLSIPHPAIMEDIDQWREFAVELGFTQGIDQLFRDIYRKPGDKDGLEAAVSKYDGAMYNQAGTLIGRSRGAGFQTSGDSISLTVLENGVEITAMLGIDAWYYDEEAALYEVQFARDGHVISPEQVGPIAWSEGIRMCEFVYAGRSISEQQEQD